MFGDVSVRYENGKVDSAVMYRSFMIESGLLLEELKIEAMMRGVRFVQKGFNNVDEVLGLKEKAIWNCTGSGWFFEEGLPKKESMLLMEFEEERPHRNEFVWKGGKDSE